MAAGPSSVDPCKLMVPVDTQDAQVWKFINALALLKWQEVDVPLSSPHAKSILMIRFSSSYHDFRGRRGRNSDVHEDQDRLIQEALAPHTVLLVRLRNRVVGASFFALNERTLRRLGSSVLYVVDYSASVDFGSVRRMYTGLIEFDEQRIMNANDRAQRDASEVCSFLMKNFISKDTAADSCAPAGQHLPPVLSASEAGDFLGLPDELLVHILRFLPICAIVRSRRVCRRLNMLAREVSLFRQVYAGCEFNDRPFHESLLSINTASTIREFDQNEFAVPEPKVVALLRAVGMHVRMLDLRNTRTSFGLALLLPQLCPELEHLVAVCHLSRSNSFSGQVFVHLATNLPALRTFALLCAQPICFQSAEHDWSLPGSCPVATRTTLMEVADVLPGMIISNEHHMLMQVDNVEADTMHVHPFWQFRGTSICTQDDSRFCKSNHSPSTIVSYDIEVVDMLVLGFATPNYPLLVDPRTNATRADIAVGKRLRARICHELERGHHPHVRAYGYFDVWFVNSFAGEEVLEDNS